MHQPAGMESSGVLIEKHWDCMCPRKGLSGGYPWDHTSIFSVVYRSESLTEKRKTNDICTYNYDFLMRTTLDVRLPFCARYDLSLKWEMRRRYLVMLTR